MCRRRSVLRKVPRGTDRGHAKRSDSLPEERRRRAFPRFPLIDDGLPGGADQARQSKLAEIEVSAECASIYSTIASRSTIWAIRVFICSTAVTVVREGMSRSLLKLGGGSGEILRDVRP